MPGIENRQTFECPHCGAICEISGNLAICASPSDPDLLELWLAQHKTESQLSWEVAS